MKMSNIALLNNTVMTPEELEAYFKDIDNQPFDVKPLGVQPIADPEFQLRYGDYDPNEFSNWDKARADRDYTGIEMYTLGRQAGKSHEQALKGSDAVGDYIHAQNPYAKFGFGRNSGNSDAFPYIYGAGANLPTKYYQTGMAFGQGDILGGVMGGVSSLLGTARTALSGYAYGKMNKFQNNEFKQRQYRDRIDNYRSAPQYMNTNGRGGLYADGGEFNDFVPMTREDFERVNLAQYALNNRNSFEDGGESLDANIPDISMGDEQGQDLGMAQDYLKQGQGGNEDEQAQQLIGQIIQYLQQGVNPQQIAQELISKGFQEQDVMLLLQQAMQVLQQQQGAGDNGGALDGNIPDFESESDNAMNGGNQEMPQMANGGSFKYKVGDYVKFEKGGKVVEGRIKSIDAKRGKFFL